jgi:hypothetical protein
MKRCLTTRAQSCFLTSVEMKNTFAKSMLTHAPVNGWMAICQRYSRLFRIVGTKF